MRNTVLNVTRNTLLSAMRNTVFELIKFCQLVPLASGPGVPHGLKHANRPNGRKNSQTVQHRQSVKLNLEQTCETWREGPQKGQLGTYLCFMLNWTKKIIFLIIPHSCALGNVENADLLCTRLKGDL